LWEKYTFLTFQNTIVTYFSFNPLFLQSLARVASKNSHGDVYFYVATPTEVAYQKEVADEGGEAAAETQMVTAVAGGNPEVDAILGSNRWQRFSSSVRSAFYDVARRRRLPQNKDVLFGIYGLGADGVTTQRELATCDFWRQWLDASEWQRRLA